MSARKRPVDATGTAGIEAIRRSIESGPLAIERSISASSAPVDSAVRTAHIATPHLRTFDIDPAKFNARSIPVSTLFPLNDALTRLIESQTRVFNDSLRNLVLPDLAASYEKLMAPIHQALDGFVRRCEELAPEKRRVLAYLAVRGWHQTLDMAWWDPELADLVDADDAAAVDEHVAAVVESSLEEILDRVREHHPDRAPIIEEALEAFREGKFATMVPAVLAQTDGVCAQILAVSAFGKDKGKPKTAAKVAALVTTSTEPFVEWVQADLLPLQEGSSLLVDTAFRDRMRETDPGYGPLNRHGVLHGADVDFGTRHNALRAFAVLGYFVGLHELLKDPASKTATQATSNA